MNPFNMSEVEKKQILQQHKKATSSFNDKKTEVKKGLQKPESKKVEPKKAVVKKDVKPEKLHDKK